MRLRCRFTRLSLKLDVKNEARVHLWYEEKFGYPIPPYRSTAAAIATFPTTATSIGVRWCGGRLECCAPYGLDDLFSIHDPALPRFGQPRRGHVNRHSPDSRPLGPTVCLIEARR